MFTRYYYFKSEEADDSSDDDAPLTAKTADRSVHMPIHIFVYMFIHMPMHISIHMCIHMSIHTGLKLRTANLARIGDRTHAINETQMSCPSFQPFSPDFPNHDTDIISKVSQA